MSAKILVIEDEERIRQFLQRGLSFEGYRVDAAEDGQAGLDMARDNPPDLVLLDLMLPGIDGLEVCRRCLLYTSDAADDWLVVVLGVVGGG